MWKTKEVEHVQRKWGDKMLSKVLAWKEILRHAGLKGGFPGIRGKTFSIRYAKFEKPVGHSNGDVFVLFAV